jgi:hypothetical protein
MVFRRASAVFRKAKDFAGQAYATVQDLAPGVKKGAEALRKGFDHADRSGLIDQVGGHRAGAVRQHARRGFDTFNRIEDVAKKADGAIAAARS